jgi:hypothetical protein
VGIVLQLVKAKWAQLKEKQRAPWEAKAAAEAKKVAAQPPGKSKSAYQVQTLSLSP